MSEELHCWRCGADLGALSLPLSRTDECPDCGIYLHVCRMCVYIDPAVARACREDDAEEVKEKERPNFCDYFRPSAHAFDSDVAAADSNARTQLDALFGAGEASVPDAGDEGGDQASDKPVNPADDLFK